MENILNSKSFTIEDLEEETIEITPVANYDLSDAQDLPETGASSGDVNCCSVVVTK